MISKVAQSSNSFDTLLNYVYEGRLKGRGVVEKNAKVISISDSLICPIDAKDKLSRTVLTQQFEDQAKAYKTAANKDVKRPAGHHIISMADYKNASDEMKKEIVEQYLKYMRLDNTQYIAISHSDTKNPHIHIIYNRVNNDNKLTYSHNEKIRASAIMIGISMRLGLALEEKQTKMMHNKHTFNVLADSNICWEMRREYQSTLGTAKSVSELENLCKSKNIPFEKHQFDNGYSNQNYSFNGEPIPDFFVEAILQSNRTESAKQGEPIQQNFKLNYPIDTADFSENNSTAKLNRLKSIGQDEASKNKRKKKKLPGFKISKDNYQKSSQGIKI